MRKAFVYRYHTSYMIAVLTILSAMFGRGIHLVLFFLPLFMSYIFRLSGRVVLRKREGNIIAGIISIVFIPLFFSKDVFVMALYYLLGLLTLKLFVSFERKDYDHVTLLGFLAFSLSTVFLYSIWYMLLFLVFGTLIAFYLFLRIVPDYIEITGKSLNYIFGTFAIIMVFSLMLFFLLPRNPYMLFGMNVTQASGDFGELEVGGLAKDALSSRVLLRVKPPDKQNNFIYVRSRVFVSFDGAKWSSLENWETGVRSRVIISENPGMRTMRFRFFPAVRFRYVPLTEYPVLLLWEKGRFAFNRNLMEVRIEKRPVKMDYTVFSTPFPSIPLTVKMLPEYLEVPESVNRYLRNIINSISFSRDTLGSIIDFLRKNYKYGRFVPEMDTIPSIVEFLLYKKKGECTEFATAFVLLARMLGYRTRLVVGFLTKEFNPVGGYFIVREKDAHAWAEVFEKGKWVRYDPTPSGLFHVNLMAKIREYYDYVQYLWFTRVVEYSYRDQMHVALKIMPYYWKLRTVRAGKLAGYIIVALLLLSMIIYRLYAMLFISFHKKALRHFFRYMKKNGFVRNRGETLMEFAIRSGDKRAEEFVKEYYEVKYGGKSPEGLKRILKSF